jgi:DNA-binding protein YbaB
VASPFSGLSRDPDEIEQQINQWAQGFAAKAERYKAAQEQVEQIRSTATSQDGGVRVTVRADGSVSDLEFTERIRSLPLRELSAQILATMRRAQSTVVTSVDQTMTEQLGDEDLETRTAMLDDLRSRFPEPEDEEQSDEAEAVSDKWDYDKEEPPPPAAPPTPPAPPAAPKPPPASPRRPRSGPDDDFDPDFDPLRD